jgi:outer membrane protein OmpA-like peptidoglycan-associated protein
MRILITGFIVLVIWSFFSMWLYVDILRPLTREQVTVQPVTPPVDRVADSLARLYASMPKELKLFFDFDKTKMLPAPGADSSIASFKEWMGKYPSSVLLVTGHTDFIGKPDYNRELALKRAETVKKFLLEKGIPGVRMETAAAEPATDLINQLSAGGRAENRKTEVSIKK